MAADFTPRLLVDVRRPERVALSDVGRIGYRYASDPADAEPDSDVYVVLHEGLVSVTPMSLDMTSRTDLFRLHQLLRGEKSSGRPKRRNAAREIEAIRKKARSAV